MPAEENIAHSMMIQNEDLMWDLMALSIKNDACRVFSLTIPLADGALMLNEILCPVATTTFPTTVIKPKRWTSSSPLSPLTCPVQQDS